MASKRRLKPLIFVGSDPPFRGGTLACDDPNWAALRPCNSAVGVALRTERRRRSSRGRWSGRDPRIIGGLIAQDQAEIREGLAEGETVVARAGAFLRDGDRVRAVTAGEPVRQ